jgi:hypothetical protein
MDVEQLRQLVSQPRETAKVDFKIQFYKISEPKPLESAAIQKWKDTKDQQWAEIVKDILALTNGNIGTVQQTAYLIIGSDDKLKADGTPNLQDVGNQVPTRKDIYEKVNSYCEPRLPNLDCEIIGLDNQQLFVISIPPSPYVHKLSKQLKTPKKDFSSHTVLLRRGDGEETYEASDEEKKALQEEKNYFFEKQTVFQRDLDELVREVRSRCCEKIQRHYSKIELINSKQIEVDALYIDVYVLQNLSDEIPADETPKNYDAKSDRYLLGQRKNEEPQPGIDIATTHPNLMVLGKPGSGKSTFLKYLAFRCSKGEFLADFTPILIELREIETSDLQLLKQPKFNLLLKLIHNHFEDLADEGQTESFLRSGNWLIFLDGFDEAPDQYQEAFQKHVRDFVRRYDQNRFILTCRVQTTEYKIPGFDYVEVADFDPPKIRQFAEKWFDEFFGDRKGQELAEKFIKTLEASEHKPTAALAVTPILLSLICWIFTCHEKLPTKRSELYRNGITLLLKEWDKKRGIERKSTLDIKQLQALLSYLAFRKFEQSENFILFKQDEILQYIEEFLDISIQDAEVVIKEIASNNGLLIQRAKGVWSFSHLTFQEYFVAKWFCDHCDCQTLSRHVAKKHWREVFLLVFELLNENDADKLMLAMKLEIENSLAEDKKLQCFLQWIDEKTKDTNISDKPAAIRAFYLKPEVASIRNHNLAHAIDSKLIQKVKPVFYTDIICVFDNNCKIILIFGFYCNSFYSFDHPLNSDLQNSLEIMEKEIPSLYFITPALENIDQMRDAQLLWIEKLRNLTIRNPKKGYGYSWRFDKKQDAMLNQYYDANRLLVDCLNSDCRVSQKVRQEIEETLLLPLPKLKSGGRTDEISSAFYL